MRKFKCCVTGQTKEYLEKINNGSSGETLVLLLCGCVYVRDHSSEHADGTLCENNYKSADVMANPSHVAGASG